MPSLFFLVETIQRKQFSCIYGKNEKNFMNFFCAFFKFTLNFQLFQKKMTLIAYIFRKLQTSKDVIRSVSKKSPFRRPLDRQQW